MSFASLNSLNRPHLPDFLTPVTLYVALSVLIAIFIWVEAFMLGKNSGKLPESSLFGIISIMTSLWLVVSGAALYFLEFDHLAISVPIVYAIYSIVGWIYGARLMGDDLPDDPRDMVVPDKYLTYSKSFSLVFGGWCLYVLTASMGLYS